MNRSVIGCALFAFIVPCVLGAKCEGEFESMGSDAGRAGSGTSGSPALPSSGSAGQGGVVHGGSSGEAGGPDCDSFRDAEEGPEVTVRLTNATADPLYLGPSEVSCEGTHPYFSLTTEDGDAAAWWHSRCDSRCEQLKTSLAGCTADCRWTPLIRLGPGASYDIPWKGTLFVERSLPVACVPAEHVAPLPPEGPFQCLERRTAAPGEYTVSADAFPGFTCDDGVSSDCGRCDGNASGCLGTGSPATWTFVAGGALVAGEPLEAQATLAHPSQDLVELRFE